MTQNNLFQFLRAVGIGGLLGYAPFQLLRGSSGVPANTISEFAISVLMGLAPLGISIIITLLFSVVIGLPLTALLRHLRKESAKAYMIAGAGFGFTIPILLDLRIFGYFGVFFLMSLLGLIAGATTGYLWGGWREKLSAAMMEETGNQSIE